MEMFLENKKETEGSLHMWDEHRRPGRPLPPNERKTFMRIEFDEADWKLLKEVFGDEDTAIAAAEIIKKAPPEIQILTIQIMDIIEEAS